MFRIGIRGREYGEKSFGFVLTEISFNYYNHIFREQSHRIVSRDGIDQQGQTNGLNN